MQKKISKEDAIKILDKIGFPATKEEILTAFEMIEEIEIGGKICRVAEFLVGLPHGSLIDKEKCLGILEQTAE